MPLCVALAIVCVACAIPHDPLTTRPPHHMQEAKNYTASGLPQRAPNSMNNYGVVLNEVEPREEGGVGGLYEGRQPTQLI